MYNYSDNVKELKNVLEDKADEIFEYGDSELREQFEKFFQFCQTHLSEECNSFNIQPALFYYTTFYSLNAIAAKVQNSYLIGVNMGTMSSLYYLLYAQNNIFYMSSYLYEAFNPISEALSDDMEYIMFQLSIIFIYYHELAHLIQMSDNSYIWKLENPTSVADDDFSVERHILELDADVNGSYNICLHLIQYFEKLPHLSQTNRNLEKLLALGTASVFSFFLIFYSDYEEMYYREHSHPHPMIRLSYVVDSFIKSAENNLPSGVDIDKGEVIRLGFGISEMLFENYPRRDIIHNFSAQFIKESSHIKEYVDELLAISKEMPSLVMNRLAKE